MATTACAISAARRRNTGLLTTDTTLVESGASTSVLETRVCQPKQVLLLQTPTYPLSQSTLHVIQTTPFTSH